jgi:hypothetical protein
MRGASSRAGGHSANPFSPHYHITGDESWFDLEYQHTSQLSVSRDEVPQRVDRAIGTVQFMLTAVCGVNGFHLLDLMLSQCGFNTQYFVGHVMVPLVQTVFTQGKIQYPPRFSVHLDNCRVHFSKVTEQFSLRIGCCVVLAYLIVPIWPHRTSGYSGRSRLDSLAEVSPRPKNH